MAKGDFRLPVVLLLPVVMLLGSCNSALVRRAELVASSRLPWWTPAPLMRSPLVPEPPPSLTPTQPPVRDPVLTLIRETEHPGGIASFRRDGDRPWNPDAARLIEEFRAQELESWKLGPAALSQQSEPLILEEILRLNVPEDSRMSPDLQKLLRATQSDLPLTLNEQVLRWVNYFLGRGRTTLRESLRRAGAYQPMISRILAERGLPQDLIYLVQAESGFRPQARSPKRATGMWQFVAGRGREYGLSQNRHVDERLDPEKATHAAARHLADLYAQFGNWYLAMAAYNCGPGGVQRAVEKTGYADYWEHVRRGVLPRETSNYVPVILAMALLAKNAQSFALEDVVPEHPIDYDTVGTHSRIGVNLIADATGATVARIKQLNPALLRSTTPDGPYSLRVPKDTAEEFEREIAAVPEVRRQSWRRHQVRPNETLPHIAARYKVRPADIATLNHLGPEGPAAGDRLTIPVPLTPDRTEAGSRARLLHYRVRPGDTLGVIARRHRVTVAQLESWNSLKGRRQLQAGEILSIRVRSSSPIRSRALGSVAAAKTSSGAGRRTASRSPAGLGIAASRTTGTHGSGF